MRVSNMKSPRSGSPVANQYVIEDKGTRTFQSYDSTIATVNEHGVKLNKEYWDYSRTTLKYLAQFLRYETGQAVNTKKDIETKIKSGEYKLVEELV